MKLFAKMKQPECLQLFKCETVKLIVTYSWDLSFDYFIYRYLVPYVALCFTPLIALCVFTEHIDETSAESSVWPAFHVTLLVFFIGNTFFALEEVHEIWHKGILKYARDWKNYYDFLSIIFSYVVIYKVFRVQKAIGDPDEHPEYLQYIRILFIISVLLNGRELVFRFTIFDRFAIFIEQMREIVKDSYPLAGMLAFIVLS